MAKIWFNKEEWYPVLEQCKPRELERPDLLQKYSFLVEVEDDKTEWVSNTFKEFEKVQEYLFTQLQEQNNS